jgi:solute carrier family 25 oxoglutarate transporter 11
MKPFVTGSISGMFATCCIQPIDMVKVRIQLAAGSGKSEGPITVASNMLKNEGIGAMYKGLSAGLTRQVVYTGARLGLFDKFTEMTKDPSGKPASFGTKAVCALSAGGLAAVLGNPADLALIRMQADGMLPEAERRGYTNVFTAFSGIIKAEGFGGLFAGWLPTSTRAMALNFGMLAFNAQAKEVLEGAGVSGAPLTFGASAIAGFFRLIFFVTV